MQSSTCYDGEGVRVHLTVGTRGQEEGMVSTACKGDDRNVCLATRWVLRAASHRVRQWQGQHTLNG